MTLLLVQIPPRPRLQARDRTAPASGDSGSGTLYSYVVSADGHTVDTVGRCAASLLPKANQVIAVLADTDVAWHHITLPKAPAARLPLALKGVLEEALLDEAEHAHLALAPEAVAGQPTWVAAVHRAWLREHLLQLEKAQVWIDRVVPSSWPDEPASGHFSLLQDTASTENSTFVAQLIWSHPRGVAVLPLHGALTKALLPATTQVGMRWSTTAAAAVDAEQWLGTPVVVFSHADRCLQAARTLWNLRQFDLARSRRGSRWLRDAWRQTQGPQWRPARWGLAALVALQLLALNLSALQLKDRVSSQRQALTTVLQTEFPHVRAVLDAPLQMEREVQALRVQAGLPSSNDLEPLLAAAASAWPSDQGPAQDLRYEAGQLSLAAAGFGPTHLEQLTSTLRASGWSVQARDGRVVLSPATAAAAQANPQTGSR
jgi:general secretion pathway protein L